MYWQVNAEAPGLIGPMDRGDKWYFMPTDVPEGVKFSPGDAPDVLGRDAVGPVEVEPREHGVRPRGASEPGTGRSSLRPSFSSTSWC